MSDITILECTYMKLEYRRRQRKFTFYPIHVTKLSNVYDNSRYNMRVLGRRKIENEKESPNRPRLFSFYNLCSIQIQCEGVMTFFSYMHVAICLYIYLREWGFSVKFTPTSPQMRATLLLQNPDPKRRKQEF